MRVTDRRIAAHAAIVTAIAAARQSIKDSYAAGDLPLDLTEATLRRLADAESLGIAGARCILR